MVKLEDANSDETDFFRKLLKLILNFAHLI